jgi:hypothetical protein
MTTTITAPDRSLEQRMRALELANTVRTSRAELKRDLKHGRRLVLDVIASPPEFTDTMKLWDVLIAAPKYGRVKVNKSLSTCRISPSKTLGGASVRQRNELIALLSGRL